MVKKRNTISIYQKQVILFMLGFAIIYLISFYIIGFYFGYYENPIKISFNSLFKYTIPIAIIIIASEVIRKVLLSQKIKFSKIITFICMVLIDLISMHFVFLD